MTEVRPDWNRLVDRIDFSQPGGCWIWTGYVDKTTGYGLASASGKTQLIHRLIWRILKGEYPTDAVDHLCRTKTCVNPLHLESVGIKENTRRGIGPSALNAQKTHCKRGHEFTDENTYWKRCRKSVQRACRECVRDDAREYQRRRRAGRAGSKADSAAR